MGCLLSIETYSISIINRFKTISIPCWYRYSHVYLPLPKCGDGKYIWYFTEFRELIFNVMRSIINGFLLFDIRYYYYPIM